ncbi:MAG: carboxypeptidase regulatory-like domain-containing protein [Negativicutes bacterium]|jgi:hypothetical protein
MRNYRNSLTWLLLVVFLFAQVIPVTAAGTTQYQDPNVTAAPVAPTFTNNSSSAVNSATDQLANYYFTQYKNGMGWDWLKTTNINFSAFSGNTPQWNLNTFQPLTLKGNLDNFLFAQGQYGTGNNTINVGLGYRSMNPKHSSLYGFNLFYDWQTSVSGEGGYNPNGTHMRVGAGLEYFTGSIETRINGYYGVSDDVQVGALDANGLTAYQHVAPGLDLSIGTDFSFWNAPWLKLTATGNYYEQTQGGTINGYQGSPLNANLTAQLQVTPQLSINGGGTVGNGGQSTGNIGFQLNLLALPVPALFLADPTVNQLAATDISYKMLQPVQRNNTITVERYTKHTSNNSQAIVVTALNSNGDPVPGVLVTLTPSNPTAAVGDGNTQATTNASGVASFSVAAGNYDALYAIGATTATQAVSTSTPPLPKALPQYGAMVLTGTAVDALTSGNATLVDQYGTAVPFTYDLANPLYRSNGNIVLLGLEPGQKYVIQLAHDGVTDVVAPVNPASNSPSVNDATVDEPTSEQITPPTATKGSVTAQINYKDSTMPQAGILVTLTPPAGGTVKTATTGNDGLVNFTNLDYAAYTLSFDATFGIADDTAVIDSTTRGFKKTYHSTTTAPGPTDFGTITLTAITYLADDSALENGANLRLTNGTNSYTLPYKANAIFPKLPLDKTYTLTAAVPGYSDMQAVTTAASLTLTSTNKTVSTSGTIDGAKPAVGSALITATANGANVTAGTKVYYDTITNVNIISSGNKVALSNLTAGEHMFALGATNAAGQTIPGAYWVTSATIVAGATTNVALNGLYNTATITTQNTDSSVAANIPVTISMEEPAAGLSASETSIRVTTNSSGAATVNLWKSSVGGPMGTYRFVATIQGTGVAGTANMDDTRPSVILKPQTAGCQLSGTVSTLDQTLLVGATVTATLSGSSSGTSTTTDDHGAYSFTGLAEGQYTVTAALSGYQTGSYDATLAIGTPVVYNFVLNPSVATGIISGVVSSATGTEGGATVNLCSMSSGTPVVVATTTSNTQGAYSFSSVVAGTYSVAATKGSTLAGSTTSFVFTAGQQKTDADVTLYSVAPVGGSISGTTRDQDGAPLGDVSVTITSLVHPEQATTVHSNSTTGAYSLAGLSLDTYGVSASKTGYTASAALTVTLSSTSPNATGKNFTMTPAGAATVTITPTTTLGTDVFFGALSERQEPSGSLRSLRTGSVTFSATAGAKATFTVGMYNESGVLLAPHLGTISNVQINAGANAFSIPLTSCGGLNVGKVYWVNTDTTLTELTANELASTSVNVSFSGQVLHNGTVLSDLVGVKYVLASGDYSMTLADGTEVTPSQSGPNILTIGTAIVNPSLYIHKPRPTTGAITGIIKSITGSPVSGVEVRLHGPIALPSVYTDNNGRYLFSNLEFGHYELDAYNPADNSHGHAAFELTSDQNIIVSPAGDVTLIPLNLAVTSTGLSGESWTFTLMKNSAEYFSYPENGNINSRMTVPVGTGYSVQVTAPAGYTATISQSLQAFDVVNQTNIISGTIAFTAISSTSVPAPTTPAP